ncbi:MAG: pantoate--beta-alanine ligase [Deltaproteobacteria bacterium]|nr:pantoate--beta-alanine ligase [Deltaproteobacteria bacterium]
MLILTTVGVTKRKLRAVQAQGLRVGFVPTMGALHEGHLALVDAARARSEVVVASIFVNPKQFGPSEDFTRYPRDLEKDATLLEQRGADVVFAPSVDEMYPAGFGTAVSTPDVAKGLCAAFRPGHFEGVATVVARLFGIVRPDVAVFGEKDFQQLAVIRRLVSDLALDVEIIGHPIVREPDGLAMSSRNAYLSKDDRLRALSLSRGLKHAEAAFQAGERSADSLVAVALRELTAEGVAPEYLELRSFELKSIDRADGPCLLLVAARFGSTRLIDNRILARP